MRFEDTPVQSIGQLIDSLRSHCAPILSPCWYRGQSNIDWKLIPKIQRDGTQRNESQLINKFKQNAALLLNTYPKSSFEWLFLMQHYSMPTRLLDWTESPLIALYFALNSHTPEGDNHDGALWSLLPSELNHKSNHGRADPYDIPSFEEEDLRAYSPEALASENRSRLLPIAAIAPRNNPRMQAQLGVFTISHREERAIEDVGAPNSTEHIWRYIIPANRKNEFREDLKVLAINRFQLFPELDSLADGR